MELVEIKKRTRKFLHFLFALFFCGDIRFLLTLTNMKGLGEMSSLVENNFLFRCAAEGYGQGTIVEIGSFKGRTTVSLALGSKLKGREKIYAVDPQENPEVRDIFKENINCAKVSDYVAPILKKSEEAAKDYQSPIRMLFIDGCHSYEEVKKDILLWTPKIIEGGIIALHDYLGENTPAFLTGVKKAVEECIIDSNEFVVEGCLDTILFASKKKSQNKHLFARFNRIQKWRDFLKKQLDRTWLRY